MFNIMPTFTQRHYPRLSQDKALQLELMNLELRNAASDHKLRDIEFGECGLFNFYGTEAAPKSFPNVEQDLSSRYYPYTGMGTGLEDRNRLWDTASITQRERNMREALRRLSTKTRELEAKEEAYRSQRRGEEYWNHRRDEDLRSDGARRHILCEFPLRDRSVRFTPSTDGGSSEDEEIVRGGNRGRSSSTPLHEPQSDFRSRSRSRISITRTRSPPTHSEFANTTSPIIEIRYDPKVFAYLPHALLGLLEEQYSLDLAGLMRLPPSTGADILAKWPNITAFAFERLAAAEDLPVPRRFLEQQTPRLPLLRARRSFEEGMRLFEPRAERARERDGPQSSHALSRGRSSSERRLSAFDVPTLPSVLSHEDEQSRLTESRQPVYDNITERRRVDSPNGPWVPPLHKSGTNLLPRTNGARHWPAEFGPENFSADHEISQMVQGLSLDSERDGRARTRRGASWNVERRGDQWRHVRSRRHGTQRRDTGVRPGVRVLLGGIH